MNIDPSEKAKEQEEQNQHTKRTVVGVTSTETVAAAITTTTTTTTTTPAVLALLISPSSPSSASTTVSPTASSISKNSSTDEVDETTAEAEPSSHQEAAAAVTAATATGEQQQLDIEQREAAADEDVHQNNSSVQQREPTEQQPSGGGTESTATMTLEETGLLAQCIPETTTDLRTPDTDASRDGAKGSRECDSSVKDAGTTVQELTAEALSPKTTPQPLSSSSSSSSSTSSTSSTPSVGESDGRLPVVPEEDPSAQGEEEGCYTGTLLLANNNPALEVDLISTDGGDDDDDGASSGYINDRYNNNNRKGSDSDFQIVGNISSNSVTQAKVSDRNDGDNATATALSSSGSCTSGGVLEEGVLMSATAPPAPEIALGQGDEQLRMVVSQRVLGNEKAKTNDDNNSELSVAPIEIVQTLPNEQSDLITTAGGVTVAVEPAEKQEGVASRSEERNKTCVSSSATGTVAIAGSSPSCRSACTSSSSESSPEVLAGSQQQQKEPSGKGCDDAPKLVVGDNRPLCDGTPKGHSLEREGFPDAIAPPPSSSAALRPDVDAGVPQCTEEDRNGSSIGRRQHVSPQVTTGTRLLTLAEELSQAGATTAATGGSSLAVSAPSPQSAVVDVLPKSAAGTVAAAVASGASRSTSPVLHSSLKKTSKMVVTTGAGTAAAATVASTAKGENRRRVSFPKDAQLITGYLDPVNPWASISICETPELLELYRSSCKRHNTIPLKIVLDHLQSIDVNKGRVPLLTLRDQQLSYSGCEALEEIFKHVQYRTIDLSHSGLDDVTACVMFDIIEYYEAATELDISDNLQMTSKTWTACINMIKKSQALNVLVTRGPAISDYQATNLAKALNASTIHTLKLEHCELNKQPIATLCNQLKRNTVLRELWLAHNKLSCEDAQQIANLLRANFYIQLIDISNNSIGDKGVEHIVSAIVEQAVYFKDVQEKKRKSDLNFSDLSSSLNNINNSVKNYFPHRLRSSESEPITAGTEADLGDATPSPLTLTPPVTPPSTPALPSCETEENRVDQPPAAASEGEKLEATNGTATTCAVEAVTVYTMQQPDNDETNPPLQLPPSSPLTTTPLGAVAPPSNVELVEMSTKHSVSLQTTSDREKLDTVPMSVHPVMMTAEEEALMKSSSSGGAGVTVPSEAVKQEEVLEDGGGGVSKTTSTSAETVQTERNIESTVGGGEEAPMLLDTHSDSPVPQAPKKPRLAKQDSVLTEFEASISSAMETGEDSGLSEQQEHESKMKASGANVTVLEEKQPRTSVMMEEDMSELCTDYDDDGSNLRISEENLFVELGIPALSEQEQLQTASEDAAPDSPGDVFSPLVAPPSKKDELQLLIEKSQQKEKELHAIETVEVDGGLQGKRDATITPSPPQMKGVERERKSAISSDERPATPAATAAAVTKKDRTQSSSSDGYETERGGIQMVTVEIKDNVALSRSLDSVGGESESDFESNSPFRTTAPSAFPNERSFSSESLNSETSIDSNDSKSSLKIHESKFAAKNGTLERQQSNVNRDTVGAEPTATNPCGLQVLVLWNNEITRSSARHFQRLLEKTSTLDTLNVGSNQLCNSFVSNISGSLKTNTTLTNLGLQSAHLSDKGVKTLAEIIEFGGNSSLQRIDLRHNNIQKAGLEALNEAMKSNKSVTRIDLDDTPRRIKDTSLDGVGSEYSRLVNNIRAQCERNKNPPEPSEPISTTVRRARANYLSSRKISLTCPSIKTSPSAIADKQHLLDPNGGCKKSTGGRLRSPLPSPIPSPIASPVPSPSRNRFHVSRVTDSAGGGGAGSATSPSPSSTGSSPTLFFPSNSRFRVVTVAEPADSGKSANNPYRSSSTISLPMSKPSTATSSYGTSCAGAIGTPSVPINRRPVCSSAPTLSSFPPSPLSPLAAGGGPVMVGRMACPASQTPSPLLPPSYCTVGGNSTFQTTTILPSPLLTAGVMAGTSPTTMPGLVPMVGNTTMPLGIPQTLLQPQQQQQHSQPQYQQQFVPMMPLHQQQQQQHLQQPTPNYHFITTFGPGNSTSIPLQPMLTQVQRYTNLTEPMVTVPPQQILQQTVLQHPSQQPIPPQTPSSFTGKGRSFESPHQHHHNSSSGSNNNSTATLHDSVLSSTSIESPDLEVKRFMSGGALRDDSCCSSISSNSIESIDNPNFNINTSISSTDESFDLIVNSPPPSVTTSVGYSGAIAGSTVVHLPPTGGSGSSVSSCNVSSISRVPEEESTLIPRALIGGDTVKVTLDAPMSLSSSSMVHVNLASSQESLYDVHDLSGSSNSSSMSAAVAANLAPQTVKPPQQPPPPVVAPMVPPTNFSGASVVPTSNTTGTVHGTGGNSNESTLTSVQNIEREPATVTKVVAAEKPPRVRKTSWILGGSGSSSSSGGGHKHNTDSSSSGGSTPTPGGGGSGYPPAIEKLLAIFHPSNLFSSSKASTVASSASPPPNTAVSQDGSGTGSQPPSRKESPMGGLFYWAHHGAGSSNASANTSPTATTTKKDDDRAPAPVASVLKVNMSPETTLTPQQLQPLQNQAQVMAQLQSSNHHHYQQQQHSAENMPPQLKVEMKENISPENTITNKLLLSSGASPSAADGAANLPIVNVASAAHAKVIFQLGGDYDESEDDIDTLTNKYGNHPSLGGGGLQQQPQQQQQQQHHQLSGPNSLLGGSTTSNSSGISIGSGTSAGDMNISGSGGPMVSPSPSATSGQSASSDTMVLSHLGQIARDSLSMFKNPSLTSQDSISIRSMDSLTEIGSESGGAGATGKATLRHEGSPAGRKEAPAAGASAAVAPTTSTTSSSSPTPLATQLSSSSSSASAPLADRQFESR